MTLFPAAQEWATQDDHWTPAWIFEDLGLRFDLDVCAPTGGVPWIPADRYYTKAEDGLLQPWHGRVWMNPPYSNVTPWARRFIQHGHGIALVSHAKSAWHPELWAAADAVAEPYEHFRFVGNRQTLVTNGTRLRKDGGSVWMPVWFAAFGPECVEALHRVGHVR